MSELEDTPQPLSVTGFHRLERNLRFMKMLAMVLGIAGTIGPLLAGYWILGEDQRARERWETVHFRDAVGRTISERSYAVDGDVKSLDERMRSLEERMRQRDEALTSQLVALRSSVDRLIGRMDAMRGAPP